MSRAALLGASGVVIGIVVARAVSRFMESLLVEVTATDSAVFVTTAIFGLLIALLAASVPVYHALRVDPSEVLRAE